MLASHAFRKICSAVKKAALFEQSIAESLFDHHPIMNTTKATPDHHKCEFAAFRLSKFFVPSATGVWGIVPQRGFGYFGPFKVPRRKAKPCTPSPAGESTPPRGFRHPTRKAWGVVPPRALPSKSTSPQAKPAGTQKKHLPIWQHSSQIMEVLGI